MLYDYIFFSMFFGQWCRAVKGGVKKKRTHRLSAFFSVIPERFERSTHALEGRCSIQLSYGTDLSFAFATAKVVYFCGNSNTFFD